MITVALIGSQGTGKTTVWEAIREARPEYRFVPEAIRLQLPHLGFVNAYEFLDRYSIEAFELFNMGSWSTIDPHVNTLLRPDDVLITDRSVVDNLAYATTHHRSGVHEELVDLVVRIAEYYVRLIDAFVYFPVGVFFPAEDEVRRTDLSYQRSVDEAIRASLIRLAVPESQVYELTATGVAARVAEVLTLIDRLREN